jgi:hypothetical protein
VKRTKSMKRYNRRRYKRAWFIEII